MSRIAVAWSSGKDSARALYELRRDPACEVVALLTTVTAPYDRVSIHGVRRALLHAQAAALALPLVEVPLSERSSNAEYEARMASALRRLRSQGVEAVAFGDIFLQDLRRWREERLGEVGLRGVFPLWGLDTSELARSTMRLGFRALLACVDGMVLDAGFAGRLFAPALLADLPAGVDPCGERGEFHTFVFDGPGFSEPLQWSLGERVTREDRFHYVDILPADPAGRLGGNLG